MYLGKEVQKYLRFRHFQARLARADEELQRKTIPLLKPTVWVKKNIKTGAPSYIKMDKRRERSLRTVKQLVRSLVQLDNKINEPFGPFPARHGSEIPLVGFDTSDDKQSTVNENSIISKLLNQEDFWPENNTPKEVSHLSFLIKLMKINSMKN